ncbi:MAG: hypothetical protein M0R75_14265 [Dehalococcoidia bacterium]|nr:hypothetical protein [Dehalococcoidia bacterium]
MIDPSALTERCNPLAANDAPTDPPPPSEVRSSRSVNAVSTADRAMPPATEVATPAAIDPFPDTGSDVTSDRRRATGAIGATARAPFVLAGTAGTPNALEAGEDGTTSPTGGAGILEANTSPTEPALAPATRGVIGLAAPEAPRAPSTPTTRRSVVATGTVRMERCATPWLRVVGM